MCGICGFSGPADHGLIRTMSQTMFHRGPDDSGYYESEEISLGIRRLSIIDVAGGHQPITNEDGAISVVYNGEIYNYRDLREKLERKGHRFSTLSDTEVIVHSYEEFGPRCVDVLWGMFCFALWDEHLHRLMLARDRIGMKPLYYILTPTGIAFASEIKALLPHPEAKRDVDAEALRLLLAFRYTPAERTTFRGIHKLLPGTILLWQTERTESQTYWRVPVSDVIETDEATVVKRVRTLLEESVNAHLRSDVPLGVMLSGGLDSSVIAVLAKNAIGDKLKTFTFDYSEAPDKGDATYSRIMAEHLCTDHKEIGISEERLFDYLPSVVYYHDEPKVDPASVPTLVAAREIRRHATVVLVGEGSDEQFGGYISGLHFAKTRQYRTLAPSVLADAKLLRSVDMVPVLRREKRLLEYLGSLKNQNRALRIINSTLFSEHEFDGYATPRFKSEARGVNLDNVYAPFLGIVRGHEDIAASYIDLSVYIPHDISMRLDKMMMASSVEARMPFLHVPILEYTPRIASRLKTKAGVSKYLLRQAMKDQLPKSIVRRRKHGIQVPIRRWVKSNMDLLEELALEFVRRRNLFEKSGVLKIVKRARSGGDENSAHHLFAIGTIELWYRMYVDPDRWMPGEPKPLVQLQ